MKPSIFLEEKYGLEVNDKPLSKRIYQWTQCSEKFQDFVKQNRKKINNKLRIKDEEQKRDAGVELYTAFAFVSNECDVIYEPAIKPRIIDFKISFDKHSFFLETKRWRNYSRGVTRIDPLRIYKKRGDLICKTLGQTISKKVNILYIRHNFQCVPNLRDIINATENLELFKLTDPLRFTNKIRHYNIESTPKFNEYWRQLSAIVVSGPIGFEPGIWTNPSAAHPIEPDIENKIRAAFKTPFRV